MYDLLFQAVIPFVLSAFIVILIMFIAERYGTKIGGIFGTLPSTIVIAFLFISLNKGIDFASQSVAVVPAELGINLIFLFLFSLLVHRSIYVAFAGSLTMWALLSSLLFFLNITNIFASLAIFIVSLGFTFTFLERFKKVPSIDRVVVHYTPMKIALRGLIAGTVIAIAVLLSNVGAVLSGIFSVFPAILSSTMLISVKEHGPDFAVGLAKSMVFGIPSVLSYATAIHFLYPVYGIIWGSICAYGISLVVTLALFKLRVKIR
ncbi:MAG: hypothetical protein KAQ84_00975 [Thermoplasmatales archaeon]|nr:hypothetical protein [Thermoplasmatales archaeon]MCK5260713.1 hypothetical protein [Thermoplasmatales archaeon]